MTEIPFTSPAFDSRAFNCPHCRAYADQAWGGLHALLRSKQIPFGAYRVSFCSHCGQIAIWKNKVMIHPDSSVAPPPNSDLPSEIRDDYLEAVSIITRSPRGSAALLRLCVQKLCRHLGEEGKNINDDIAELVKKGLNPRIQQGLDIVRTIGNEAVHPGTIDLRDNPEIAIKLCMLINIIVDQMITQPKLIDELYGSLPEKVLDAIEKRDG